MGVGLPRKIRQFLHLNQPGVENLICHLTNRHPRPLGHAHKGALDVGVDGSSTKRGQKCLPKGNQGLPPAPASGSGLRVNPLAGASWIGRYLVG